MQCLLAILILSALILLVEWIMWRLFCRRAEGLMFPRSRDESFFRFFTLPRVRAIAIIHAAVLLVISDILLFLVW